MPISARERGGISAQTVEGFPGEGYAKQYSHSRGILAEPRSANEYASRPASIARWERRSSARSGPAIADSLLAQHTADSLPFWSSRWRLGSEPTAWYPLIARLLRACPPIYLRTAYSSQLHRAAGHRGRRDGSAAAAPARFSLPSRTLPPHEHAGHDGQPGATRRAQSPHDEERGVGSALGGSPREQATAATNVVVLAASHIPASFSLLSHSSLSLSLSAHACEDPALLCSGPPLPRGAMALPRLLAS